MDGDQLRSDPPCVHPPNYSEANRCPRTAWGLVQMCGTMGRDASRTPKLGGVRVRCTCAVWFGGRTQAKERIPKGTAFAYQDPHCQVFS